MRAANVGKSELNDYLRYELETGLFFWLKSPAQSVKQRTMAGTIRKDGYVFIKLKGKQYYAHRLAWEFVHGAAPCGHIDHINGDKTDNRIANLRNVSRNVNMQNMRCPTRRNKSGYLGVCQSKTRWAAFITVDTVTKYIGKFDTAEMAHEAYLTAKRKLHKGCTI